jgi:NAD+ diphosphatase
MRSILNPPPHVYTSQGFDRAAPRRKDQAWLEQRRRASETRVLPLAGLQIAIAEDAPQPQLFWAAAQALPPGEDSIFLGLQEDAAIFAQEVGEAGASAGARFVELRSVGPVLSAAEASLAAYARALAHWHTRHRFCGACGAPTRIIDAGHARRCTACESDVFPRTDPAVIVLVTKGDRCILGRAGRFPTGMYSTLAGFVEPGESLESGLAREVFEEVGVELESVSYRSSQPWPFPQSLMLGFRAVARTERLEIELDELEDARWFERADLLDPERRPVQLPAPDSIARFLIEEWLAEAR